MLKTLNKIPFQRLYQPIEKFMATTGKLLAWLTLLLVLLEFLVVVLRYILKIPSIELQESALWIHSIIFMVGAAYTLTRDEHVRVDIIYRKKNWHYQAWVDVIGTLFLLFPVCFYLFFFSLDTVIASWRANESSGEVGGLPALYLLKSLMLVMPVMLAMQGVATLLKNMESLLLDHVKGNSKQEVSI